MKTLLAVLVCALCMSARAAPPPAPVITVAATDVRQLEFNWEPVPGVQSYELWFRSAPGAAWVKYATRDARRAPMFRIGVPVHLLNWTGANYYVKACNNTGCNPSNVVGVADERLAAIGFFKPRATSGVGVFGDKVALSADGSTLAVVARETIGSVQNTLVAYVYRKTNSTSAWRREARLLPSVVQPFTWQFVDGDTLALSADGNVLVLGSHNEDAASLPEVGAVYVFRRSGTTWSLSQRLVGSGERDFFGMAVKIDDAARTLVVHHIYPGTQYERGTLEIYRLPAGGGQFVHDMSLPPPPRGSDSYTACGAFALSGNGNTLVRTCSTDTSGGIYVHTGPGFAQAALLEWQTVMGLDLSDDGTVLLVQNFLGANAYRLGAGGWQSEGLLDDGGSRGEFGRRHVAISGNGKIAAIGNYAEKTLGRGPIDPPFVPGDDQNASGGVMVYQYAASGWRLRRLVKPGSTNVGYAGFSVALSSNGNVLAVGAPIDPSAAAGIDGDRDDASAPNRGAVWLY